MAIGDFLLNPTTISELLALLAALILLPKVRPRYAAFFTGYLVFILAIEASGYYFRFVLKQPNSQLYNLLMGMQLLFFAWLFYRAAENRASALTRVIFMALAALIITETVIRFLYSPVTEHYSRYSRIALGVTVIFSSGIYYMKLLKDDRVTRPMSIASFWLVTGLFFYYLGSTPMFAFYKEVSKIKLAGNVSFYNLAMGCINAILYGCWIIGFTCHRKNLYMNRSPSSLPS